jgi:hypothetical protein
MVYQSYLYSDEPRMAGIATWRGSHEINLTTGDGRAWSTGWHKTAMGSWHIVVEGGYDGGVGFSYAKGNGVDGLQGQKMFYEGSVGGEAPENPCAPEDPYLVMMLEGWIIDQKGH